MWWLTGVCEKRAVGERVLHDDNTLPRKPVQSKVYGKEVVYITYPHMAGETLSSNENIRFPKLRK